jgi:phosphoribosyl 1,2-cyclic phosphodiesterase
MIAIPLQSGSAGNSIYVEAGGVRLLFDAGISGIQAEARLAMHGRDIRSVDALIISHDHTDHISRAGVFNRKYGIPLHVSRQTYEAAADTQRLGVISGMKHFRPGDRLELRGVSVETLPTAHDGVEGSCFVVEAGGQRLGILTDLGHAFEGLGAVISSLGGVFLESNYDPRMLETGPYPQFLKARISGERGHLSNDEAAKLLRDNGENLKWACLSHLSENNNHPSVAMKCHKETLGDRFPLYTASRRDCSGVFTL